MVKRVFLLKGMAPLVKVPVVRALLTPPRGWEA